MLIFHAPHVDKDMVGDGIPGVVNADKEQKQRGRTNAKEGLARVRVNREGRQREYGVRHQGSATWNNQSSAPAPASDGRLHEEARSVDRRSRPADGTG